jgi:hypothetical protein
MKYQVTFSVTDVYPTVAIEAHDRDESIKLYRDMWKDGKLTADGITKDAEWRVVSHREAYKPKGS